MAGYDDFHNEYGYSYDDLCEPNDCAHDDYDVDFLTGRASCPSCGESWSLSEKEWLHHIDMQSAAERHWAEEQDRWEREERIARRPWNRLIAWARTKLRPAPVDDIPF